MKYLVVFEKSPRNYGAWVPDLPGCVATAKTKARVERLIREAIYYHLEITREYGDPVPPSSTYVKEIDITRPARASKTLAG